MREMFDFVLAFVTAANSSVDEQTSAVRVSTSGIGSFDFSAGEQTLEDTDGELGDDQEMFSALGFISRPRDPEKLQGKEYRAEAIAARTADGLVPLSWRDLRFERYIPNGLPKGSVRMVGYGGAFCSLDVRDGASPTENIFTCYVPYQFSGTTPSKAHSVIVSSNPDDGISLTHGDGYQVALTSDGILMRTSDGQTFFNMKEGEINLQSAKILLKGNVYAGSQAEVGIPLLAGPASPPCPSLFVSPV